MGLLLRASLARRIRRLEEAVFGPERRVSALLLKRERDLRALQALAQVEGPEGAVAREVQRLGYAVRRMQRGGKRSDLQAALEAPNQQMVRTLLGLLAITFAALMTSLGWQFHRGG